MDNWVENYRSIAGFDVERGQATEVLRAYFQCVMANASSGSMDIQDMEAVCGRYPAQILDTPLYSATLTSALPAAGFNLQANNTYIVLAAQYKSSNPAGLTPEAWATTTITPSEGNNDVELNLFYGSWQFDGGPSLQLLNRSTYAFGDFIGFNEESLGESLDWWPATAEDISTPAMALGLANSEESSVQLDRLHLKSYRDIWENNQVSASRDDEGLLFGSQEDTGSFDLFSLYPFGVLAPHQPLLQTAVNGDAFFVEPKYEQVDGTPDDPGLHLGRGVYEPTTLMQQFDPEQSQANRHRLNLGTWEVVIEEEISPERAQVFAGLMMVSEENEILNLLRDATDDGEGQRSFDQLQVVEPVFGMPTAALPESGLTVAYFDIKNQQGQLLVAEGTDTQGFQALDGIEPTRITAADRIQGSLIEYVGYYSEEFGPVTEYPILLMDDEGNFTIGDTTIEVDEFAFAGSAVASSSSSYELPESRKTSTQALILRHLQLNALAAEQGISAAAIGCFVMDLESQGLSSFYLFDSEENQWLPGVPEQGYWYQAEDGSYLRGADGEIQTFGTGASPSDTQQDDEGVTYFIRPSEGTPGIVAMQTSEEALEQNFYATSETGTGKAEVCVQPISLTASPYRDPRDTAEGDINIQ